MQPCALRRCSRYQQQFAVRHFSRSFLVLEGTTKTHNLRNFGQSCGLQRLGGREAESGQKFPILLASTFPEINQPSENK